MENGESFSWFKGSTEKENLSQFSIFLGVMMLDRVLSWRNGCMGYAAVV
jgi:hypothetical protein